MNLLDEFERDLVELKQSYTSQGFIALTRDLYKVNCLLLDVADFQVDERNNDTTLNRTIQRRSDRSHSEFNDGHGEMLSRYIQSIHLVATKYLESMGRGDQPIVDRLEHIHKKYKSLGSKIQVIFQDNQMAKRSLKLLGSTCKILLQIFKMWKEHLINVSEILFEVGEGARQITFNRSYDEESMVHRFQQFELKIHQSVQLIERDAFSNLIDENLLQIEEAAENMYKISSESVHD